MSVTLYIDSRESKLIQYLTHINVNFIQKQLDIGDILIESIEPQFNIIIERKTYSDLVSSIKDGRYKEQKIRLLATNPPHNSVYIFEGNPKEIDESILNGVIYHTMFRDKMHILFTDSVEETGKIVCDIFAKCQKNPQKFVATETDYLSQVKVKTCNECEKCVKRISVSKKPINNFNLGYILLDNQPESFYRNLPEKYYIKELILVREEQQNVFNLKLPIVEGDVVIPDNKIIFTNNVEKFTPVPKSIGYLDYYSTYNMVFQQARWQDDEFIELTLFNHNGDCKYACVCRTKYTVFLKKIKKNPEKFCIKYMWTN